MKYKFCTFLEKQKRVDMYLSALFEEFSRSYIQKIIDKWQVQINGENISKNIKVKPKDEISVEIILEKMEILPEKMDLEIVFEDDEIMLINKDAGVNVHPVPGEWGKSGTLVNGILEHCKNKLPSINGVERPGIVHRLDKETSGIIMIAKSDKMMNYLSDTIKNRKIHKEYIAIVSWKMRNEDFKIESYIGRHKHDRTKMTAIDPINPKYALSYWKVLQYIWEDFTVVQVKIETGRTHQIRVHLASIWYPIIGDKVYGTKKINDVVSQKFWLQRQALHAFELWFELYWEEKIFQAELKNDMKKIIWNK